MHAARRRTAAVRSRCHSRSSWRTRVDPATHQLICCEDDSGFSWSGIRRSSSGSAAGDTVRSGRALPGRSTLSRADPARTPSSESSARPPRYRARFASTPDGKPCIALRKWLDVSLICRAGGSSARPCGEHDRQQDKMKQSQVRRSASNRARACSASATEVGQWLKRNSLEFSSAQKRS